METVHGSRPNFTCLAQSAVAAIGIFPDASLISRIGEERESFFFFFLGLTGSMLPKSALTGSMPRPYKRPFRPLLAYFNSFSPQDFLECSDLSGSVLSAFLYHFNQLFLSFLHLRFSTKC